MKKVVKLMKTRSQREQELLSSGLVDSIKGLFQNSNAGWTPI